MEKFTSWLNAMLWSKKNDTNGEEIPGVDPVERLTNGNLVLTNGDPNKLDSFGNSVKASFVDMEFMNAFISLVGESVIGSIRIHSYGTSTLPNHKFLDWRVCNGAIIGKVADFQPLIDLHPEYKVGIDDVKLPDFTDAILKMRTGKTIGDVGGSNVTDVAYSHPHTATTTIPAHTGSITFFGTVVENHENGNILRYETGAQRPQIQKNSTNASEIIHFDAPHNATTTIADSTGGNSTKDVENYYKAIEWYICVGIKKDAFKHAGNP